MKNNIMILTPCFGYGGMEQVVLSLLEETNKSKYNISLCTLLKPNPEMRNFINNSNIKLFVLNKKEGFDVSIPNKLNRS